MIAALDEVALAHNRAGVLAPVQRRELDVLLLAVRPYHRVPIFSASLALVQQLQKSELEQEAQSAYLNYPRLPGAAGLARDLELGRVDSAFGVCHSPRDCTVEGIDEHVFGILGLTLMPGHYRFYYAPNSHVLVHAEPVEPTQNYLLRHRAALQQLFGGGDADLEANRDGALSGRQRIQQSSFASARGLASRALWCLLVGIPLLALYSLLVEHSAEGSAARYLAGWLLLPACLAGVYLVVIVAGGVFAALSQGGHAASQQLGLGTRSEVSHLEGIVSRYPSEDSGHPFQLLVGGQVLGLRADPAPIVYGLRYRAHHHDRELIGLEPLEGPCGRTAQM